MFVVVSETKMARDELIHQLLLGAVELVLGALLEVDTVVLDVTTGLLQAVGTDVLAREDGFQTLARSVFQHLGVIARDDAQSPLAVREVVVAHPFRLVEDGLCAVVEQGDGAEIVVLHLPGLTDDFVVGRPDGVALLPMHRLIPDLHADEVGEHPFEAFVVAFDGVQASAFGDETAEVGMHLDLQHRGGQ